MSRHWYVNSACPTYTDLKQWTLFQCNWNTALCSTLQGLAIASFFNCLVQSRTFGQQNLKLAYKGAAVSPPRYHFSIQLIQIFGWIYPCPWVSIKSLKSVYIVPFYCLTSTNGFLHVFSSSKNRQSCTENCEVLTKWTLLKTTTHWYLQHNSLVFSLL